MPTYVTLVNYTTDGIEQLTELDPDDVGKQTREIIETRGGELLDFYLTMGGFDAVVVSEFPDDQAAATALLDTGALGIAETQTLTAFSEAEIKEIVAELGR